MEALSSMRRDAEVAPKCLLRSLVIRKERDSLERTLEAKERRRRREEGKVGREGRVIMVGCITSWSSRNNARGPVEHRDNGITLTCSKLRLYLSSTEDST